MSGWLGSMLLPQPRLFLRPAAWDLQLLLGGEFYVLGCGSERLWAEEAANWLSTAVPFCTHIFSS